MATGVMDPRGVLRGRCDSPGCSCRHYAFTESGKCALCFHHPAKHLKVGPNSGAGQFHTPPQQHAHYVPAPSASFATNSGPILNNCSAIGCTRKVHYDPELGPFDYCSPECRDRDLLPRERERLRKEIEANKASMATTVIPTFTPEPSSPSSSRASNSASYTPPSSSKDHSSSSAPSASTFSGKVVAAGTTIDGKKRVMVTFEKSSNEPLGIITTQLPGEAGFRIVGVQLKTPAYHAMKEGQIKFLDVITQLNEDNIESKKWFEQITKSKTRPLLTIQRNQNTPSGIKSLFNKVEKFPTATHIRMAVNPAHISAVDFGIEPFKTTTGTGPITGYYFGVIDDKGGYTAHMSGITIRDEVILYGTMNSKQITEGRVPFSETSFKDDIERAKKDGKHLVLALKNHPMV
jgi:hypothetical protein